MTVTDPSALLDTVNRRLLRELAAEPRITMSALARRVGMSAPAVTERVQRLDQAGGARPPGHRVRPHPPDGRAAAQDRRTGRRDARGLRMPPHQWRRLLPDQNPR